LDQQQIIDVSGTRLTTSDVAAVARDNFAVRLSQEPDIRKKILASRELLEEKLRRGEIIYGVNTGLGGNAENSLKEAAACAIWMRSAKEWARNLRSRKKTIRHADVAIQTPYSLRCPAGDRSGSGGCKSASGCDRKGDQFRQ
jgi:histidine ammonia-lyase